MIIQSLTFLLFISASIIGFSQSTYAVYPNKLVGTIEIRTLNMVAEPQTQSNWCWAAVSATVINHYNYNTVDPCQVASLAFKTNCCNAPAYCNKQNSVDFIRSVISYHGIGVSSFSQGIVTKETIKSSLDNDNPLILRIESHYGGHFIVIGGYAVHKHADGKKELRLMIQDPMWGYMEDTDMTGLFISYAELMSGNWSQYKLNWTHTLQFYEEE